MSLAIDLSGKKGMVLGVANDQSIAYGCALALREAGAMAAFLVSDLAANLTGSTLYVDAGDHIMA